MSQRTFSRSAAAPKRRRFSAPRARGFRLAAFTTLTMALWGASAGAVAQTAPNLAQGMVWQVDNATAQPTGTWDQLGATELLVQWTAVDKQSFDPAATMARGSTFTNAASQPDWERIAREPWAHTVIVGLSGRFSESEARSKAQMLTTESRLLAQSPPPVNIVGWYFPVEVDPTWTQASQLAPLLKTLPRPLWISVYDKANIGGPALANWLATWLPSDVGIMFQDGSGDNVRGPAAARQYLDALSSKLGPDRVRVIAEAFRPQTGGGYRPATAAELSPQLTAYQGVKTYIFDGPHYVSPTVVQGLLNKSAPPPP